MLSAKKQKSISSFFSSQNSPNPTPRDATRASKAPTRDTEPTLTSTSNESALPVQAVKARKHRLEKKENDEPHEPDDDDDDNEPVRPSVKRQKRTVGGFTAQPRLAEGRPGPRSSSVSSTSSDRAATRTEQPISNVRSSRTSRYLFSSSIPSPPSHSDPNVTEVEPEDETERKRKERLHQQFVEKLGQPNSLPTLRNRWPGTAISGPTMAADEENDPQDGDDGVGEEDQQLSGSRAKTIRKGSAAKAIGHRLTPLEKQVLEIKRKYLDTVLVVEVGYKFRFFGEDARIAARELSIVCIPGKIRYDEHPSEAHLDRFASASIPVHRLHVHVKRLVDAGHKVGVVRQLETAALKAAGDNRNAPFTRKLTNVYTKGTYIDEVECPDTLAPRSTAAPSTTGYLLCVTESNAKGWGTDEKVHVGIIAVQPATGDIIYDDFEDGFMRTEVESRLLHISPCEFLIVGQLSKATEKMIQHLCGYGTHGLEGRSRVERVEKPKTMAAQSYNHLSTFYAGIAKSTDDCDHLAANLLDRVSHLSEHVTICLSAMITHLTEYGLQHVFDLTKYFQPFGARTHMLLNGNTLTSLEIYHNQTDYSTKGSLFWCLDRTRTRFGQRLLRKWVGRPLLDKSELNERVAAVEELKDRNGSTIVHRLKNLLSKIKLDLEKTLIRIYYGKCTRPELLNVLQTLQHIANEFGFVTQPTDTGLTAKVLNDALISLPGILQDVVKYLERINPEAAKQDNKFSFFREDYETEAITEHNFGIASVEHDLDVHRAAAAEKVRKKKIDYVTVAGIEYLIEIDNAQLKNVPASWTKVSGTKKVSRFHTPEVVKLVRERDQHKEALAAACDAAFGNLLKDLSSKYQIFRDCIQSLAVLDCLVSLAEVAAQPGYVKPEFVDETEIAVEQGRHPMVEQLLLDSYVPNDIRLCSTGTRALLVTGPNMGGKSSYVRQVALIAIMGQVGSYVPAASARLGMLDAVFTRMGAFDNMMAGESTFMVELSETSDILKQASSRSLIILDELGRGTSTHDGVAIAQAVLDHIVREIRCLTLFITHYQTLSGMARGYENNALKNVHMRFAESGDHGQDITFLYEVGEGVAHRSYGLNVARLAHLPSSVIDLAAIKSKELEHCVLARRLTNLSRMLTSVVLAKDAETVDDQLEQMVTGIEQL